VLHFIFARTHLRSHYRVLQFSLEMGRDLELGLTVGFWVGLPQSTLGFAPLAFRGLHPLHVADSYISPMEIATSDIAVHYGVELSLPGCERLVQPRGRFRGHEAATAGEGALRLAPLSEGTRVATA
jgi:hypothetical protein